MQKNSKDVVIVSALRTVIGKYNGIWAKIEAHNLGRSVIQNILLKSKVNKSSIDEVIMGQVLTGGAGQNPARQAARGAGIQDEKTAYVINQVCGSGLRAIISGYQSILLNDSKIIIAGGQENMSLSNQENMLQDGLIDAFNKYHMGVTAENVADKCNISRKEQDNFALSSQKKTQEAIKNKKFKDEILDDKSNKNFLDEHPRSTLKLFIDSPQEVFTFRVPWGGSLKWVFTIKCKHAQFSSIAHSIIRMIIRMCLIVFPVRQSRLRTLLVPVHCLVADRGNILSVNTKVRQAISCIPQ